MSAQPIDELMTVDEVAAVLRVTPGFVYTHAKAGDLPAVRIGRTLRFERRIVTAVINGEVTFTAPKPSGGRRSRRSSSSRPE
jgi:excisionase family DNA binding protein